MKINTAAWNVCRWDGWLAADEEREDGCKNWREQGKKRERKTSKKTSNTKHDGERRGRL